MDQKKQIEEMAKIAEEAIDNQSPTNCPYHPCCYRNSSVGCDTCVTLNALYNAGYRKQSKNTIELPCKAGDTIYRIVGNKIVADLVLKIEIAPNDRITIFYNWHGMGYEMSNADQIGKTIFLTAEEAELAKKGGVQE